MLDLVVVAITLGAVYALVATGLAIVFGILNIVNFAHGEFFMVGAFSVYLTRSHLGWNYGLSVIAALALMAVFGLVVHLAVTRPILGRPRHVGLVATLAVSIVLGNGAIYLFGATPRHVSTGYEHMILRLGDHSLSYHRILIVVVTVAVFAGLLALVQYTKLGKAMRAASQNPEACVVYGINLDLVTGVTVVVAALLAGLAGALVAPVYSVWPLMGLHMIARAFAIVVVGGFGNVQGAVVGAVILGFIETFVAAYVSQALVDGFVFLTLILVLVARPEGLFGMRGRVA